MAEDVRGGAESDELVSVQQTPDGGYIALGTTSSSGAGKQDIWILKLDVSGNLVWQKTYGGAEDDTAASLDQTRDGGYVFAGTTSSSGAGKKDFIVLKMDKDGNVEWQKTYGGAEDDEAVSIRQTTDEGFILAGSTLSSGAGKKDVWVLKLGKDGGGEWQKTYGGAEDEEAVSALQTSDGKYIVAANTSSFRSDIDKKRDIWLLSLESDGTVEWEKTYGVLGTEIATSIVETTDKGFLVTGWTDSYVGKVGAWVLKLDSVGSFPNPPSAWQRVYGGAGDDRIFSGVQMSDGKYLLAGSTDSYGTGKRDAWVLKLDAAWNTLWQKTWGGTADDEAVSLKEALDGGIIVGGWTTSSGGGNEDFILTKLDAAGNVPECRTLGPAYAAGGSTSVSGVESTATVKDTSVTATEAGASTNSTEVTPNEICMVQSANLLVEPVSIDFGSITYGTNSGSQSMTVQNVGSKDLKIATLDFTGINKDDFAFRADNCSGKTLTFFQECTVELVFSPTAIGKRTASLSIPSDDSNFPAFLVAVTGEGEGPIELTSPPNHTSFSSCSMYDLPAFSWEAKGLPFKSYELQFSKDKNFPADSIPVKVRTNANSVIPKANAWKQVLSIPAGLGGVVYWRVLGMYSNTRGFVSLDRSFTVEPARPVEGPMIEPTNSGTLPTLSWENDCNSKFKVTFGNNDQFTKKYSISYTVKNPAENEGTFSQVLTSRQWASIRKLVGDHPGSTLYWKVESWDGAGRWNQIAPPPFTLEE